MATYRIGDRVKVVAVFPNTAYPEVLGAEGVIAGYEEYLHLFRVRIRGDDGWFFRPEHLAPILPTIAEILETAEPYTPDAEDLATQEGGTDFRVIRPDYFPPVVLPGVTP